MSEKIYTQSISTNHDVIKTIYIYCKSSSMDECIDGRPDSGNVYKEYCGGEFSEDDDIKIPFGKGIIELLEKSELSAKCIKCLRAAKQRF